MVSLSYLLLGLGLSLAPPWARSVGLRQPPPSPPPPSPAGAFAAAGGWRTAHNALYHGGQPFRLKGINWNGVESDCRVVHGLWANTLEHYLGVLRDERFNAVRLPIPYEAMADRYLPVKPGCTAADPRYPNVHAFLEAFLDAAWRQGMYVLFDLHTIGAVITEYPWTADVTEAAVVDGWGNFAQAYAAHPAVLGLEIKNEPHGPARMRAFHRHCKAVIERVLAVAPGFDGLFFISGTTDAAHDPDKVAWGGTIEGLPCRCDDDALCQLDLADRIVFCPHVYGPDVRGAAAVAGEGNATFERRFGFLRDFPIFNGSAIVVTEFGGHLQELDMAYFEGWLAFMQARNYSTNAFFWTFPPTSADTGGLLGEDWATLDPDKLAFLERLPLEPS